MSNSVVFKNMKTIYITVFYHEKNTEKVPQKEILFKVLKHYNDLILKQAPADPVIKATGPGPSIDCQTLVTRYFEMEK